MICPSTGVYERILSSIYYYELLIKVSMLLWLQGLAQCSKIEYMYATKLAMQLYIGVKQMCMQDDFTCRYTDLHGLKFF